MGQDVQFLTGAGGVPAPAVRAQLARIVESPAFARAPRLRRFLTYCVEAALEGRRERLKEYALGVDVFDRGPGFDPKADPIVRVDARRLRERISAYYGREGVGDPVEITLSPGGYAPVFRLRSGGRTVQQGVVRLAVAPFQAPPDDAPAQRFAEGLTDELLLALTGRPQVRVIAAPRAPHDASESVALAQELDAQTLLTGKVRREGGRLRVRAALTAAADGAQTWADRYDAPADDIDALVALPDELARRIAAVVAPRLAPEPSGRRRPQTRDLEAYELFLRGRRVIQGARLQTLPEAFELLKAATTRDPGFAEALAELAQAHFLSFLFMLAPPREALAASRRAAEAALAVDQEQAAAHAYLARVSAVLDCDFAAAEAGLDRALAIDPTNTNARHARAVWLLAPLGRLDEAVAELAALLDRDPYSLTIRMDHARVLTYARRFEEAVRHLELILAFDDAFPAAWWALGFLYERLGRMEEARAAHARHVRQIPYPLVETWLEAARAGWSGDAARARALVEQMEVQAQGAPAGAGVMANAWIRLGEADRAIAWMEKAADLKIFRASHYAVDPDFESLHGHPRFVALLERLGLGGVGGGRERASA